MMKAFENTAEKGENTAIMFSIRLQKVTSTSPTFNLFSGNVYKSKDTSLVKSSSHC